MMTHVKRVETPQKGVRFGESLNESSLIWIQYGDMLKGYTCYEVLPPQNGPPSNVSCK